MSEAHDRENYINIASHRADRESMNRMTSSLERHVLDDRRLSSKVLVPKYSEQLPVVAAWDQALNTCTFEGHTHIRTTATPEKWIQGWELSCQVR